MATIKNCFIMGHPNPTHAAIINEVVEMEAFSKTDRVIDSQYVLYDNNIDGFNMQNDTFYIADKKNFERHFPQFKLSNFQNK